MSRTRIAGARSPLGNTIVTRGGMRRRHSVEDSPDSDSPPQSWTGRLMSTAREAMYGATGIGVGRSTEGDAAGDGVGPGGGGDGAAYYEMPLFAAGAAVMADHFCDSLLCQSFFALQVMHICDQLLHAPNDEVVLNRRAASLAGSDAPTPSMGRNRPMAVTSRVTRRASDTGAAGEAARAATTAANAAHSSAPDSHTHSAGHVQAQAGRPPRQATRAPARQEAPSAGERARRSALRAVVRQTSKRQYSSRGSSIGGKALHSGSAGGVDARSDETPSPPPNPGERKEGLGRVPSPMSRRGTVRAAWAAAVFADAGHRWRTRNRGQLHQVPIPEEYTGRRFRDFFRHMLLARQVRSPQGVGCPRGVQWH